MYTMTLVPPVQFIVWDLDPDFIAYYEIDMGSDYILLSSGRKTGDFRKVESGPDPRPTDVLIEQAHEERSALREVLSAVTNGIDNL